MKFIPHSRSALTTVLVAAVALAGCKAEERPAPVEQPAVQPEIVELNDPVDDPLGTMPIAGDTGMLAQAVGELPDHFAFVDETGAERTFAELRGKFVVVDFMFTSCPNPCPVMAERFAELQAVLRDSDVDDVHLLSITVDPQTDTVDVLREYAKTVGADPERWTFARMPIGFVNVLTREEFLVGDAGTPLAHSRIFVLADKAGRGRAHYDAVVDADWLVKITKDLDKLRGEPQ